MLTRGTNVLFRDVSLILVAVLATVLIIILPYLADLNKKEQSIPPQGSMIFTISWDDKIDVDIDMWVKSVVADEFVGYVSKHSDTMDLLRDDLGYVSSNPDDLNAEIVYARKIIPGGYVFNAHYFSGNHAYRGPIIVYGKVIILNADGSPLRTVFEDSIILKVSKQEKTFVQFVITEDGNIVSWSTRHSTIMNGVRIDD